MMARALDEPPPRLLELDSDDLIISIFVRAPFFSHGTLRVVSRRAKALLDSAAFREWRLNTGQLFRKCGHPA